MNKPLDVSAIIMRAQETVLWERGKTRTLKDEYISRGIGQEYATGALAAAATAPEAVEVAQMWLAWYASPADKALRDKKAQKGAFVWQRWIGLTAAIAIVAAGAMLGRINWMQYDARDQIAGYAAQQQSAAASYQVASSEGALPGANAMVRFSPFVKAADINEFLGSRHAVIVDGPRAGDLYRIRVGDEDLRKLIAFAADDKSIVTFVAPSR